MKTKRISSKQLIALVLILIGAVSSIFGITGLTKSSSEDPYESRNGIVMVYATVYDNEGNSEAGMGTGWAIGTPLGLAELCSFKFVIRGGGQIR